MKQPDQGHACDKEWPWESDSRAATSQASAHIATGSGALRGQNGAGEGARG